MSQIGLVEIFNMGEGAALIVMLFVILYFSVIWVLENGLVHKVYIYYFKKIDGNREFVL